ncbi:MAG: 2OG-Fe(II) oxygenase [Gammaproteobacteria bacterium]|nr:2OG-Fe(II) oxygenase [Gammaproteobacteria bacterium]
MRDLIDLEAYPLDQPECAAYSALVQRCRCDLASGGMFNLPGFIRPEAIQKAVAEVTPILASDSFEHHRRHNIFFRDEVEGIPADHPAMQEFDTINHAICADQIEGSIVSRVYEYTPLLHFLADAMDKENLYLMDDPLARVNVMATRNGEALNWHFDQSEYTTTIMLQASYEGGELEYHSEIRSPDNPNLEGIVRLINGNSSEHKIVALTPGTLNVFRGVNTPHRVTTVGGSRDRIMTIYSFYEQPGINFSDEMRIGFYGRAS